MVVAFLVAGCGGTQTHARTGSLDTTPALGPDVLARVPVWVKREHLPPAAVPGAKLFAVAGCANCHAYEDVGGSNLGGRDLSREGTRHGVAYLTRYIACAHCVDPASVMPEFSGLGGRRLRQIAIFLAASKGDAP